jgi:hypothetical protein
MSNKTPPSNISSSSAYDGISVKHMYRNPKANRVILYGQNEAAYDNLLVCKSGVSNIDNTCLCPGSSNSTPFNTEANMFPRLFVPEQPGMMAAPTSTARCLMAQRRPLHPNAPYESYLGSCTK